MRGSQDYIYINAYCLCMNKKSHEIFREGNQVTGNKSGKETLLGTIPQLKKKILTVIILPTYKIS